MRSASVGAIVLAISASATLTAQRAAPSPLSPQAQIAARGGSPAVPQGRAQAGAGEIRVTKVRPNVFMLTGAGANITVMPFSEGAVVVDSGTGAMAGPVLEVIKRLSDKPIADIINTSGSADHVGGNAALHNAGRRLPFEVVTGEGPMVIAHEKVLTRLSAAAGKEPPAPETAWPNETYHIDYKKLSSHFHGGEAIEVLNMPAAHSDGDSIVWFRKADVIATGDVFMTTTYPIIETAHGGTIDGVLSALNRILDIAFPDFRSEGGTMIIPGHGRLCDTADVGYYRDMLTIIRDRVREMINQGMTLEQVKAARPTRDYDGRFGATSGPWTTDMFVEAVYNTLGEKK